MRAASAIRVAVLFPLLAAGLPHSAPCQRGKDQEVFNQAKVLMFDKKWEEARVVFQRVVRDFPSSGVVPQAYFFNARCLQLQGRFREAIPAYQDFLTRYPSEPFLPAEARNAVVEMSASLFEKGDGSYKDLLLAGLGDSRKEVRYFTALRCSYLEDSQLNSRVVPVLREITREERERDLVDRARIALLRIDPKSLSAPEQAEKPTKDDARSTGKSTDTRLFHLQVIEEGNSEPRVELNIPVSLAQLAIAALDESTRREMRKKGIDVDNIWESLKRMGPTDILTFRNGRNIVKIWIR
jgi:tetratricopeptide (TPR) repeat protein